MRALAIACLGLLGPASLAAEGRTELDILRARCGEQERQIRALEKEIESLHSQLALERRRSRGVEPSAAEASPLPPAPKASYTVAAGDTLSSIARRYRTSADLLMKSNGIDDPTRLRVGQTLTLPAEAQVPASTPAPAPAKTEVAAQQSPEPKPAAKPAAKAPAANYEVRRGDTLYGIARQHQMSIADLRSLNPKVAEKIVVGQQLAVSGTPKSAPAPALPTSQTQTISVRKDPPAKPKPAAKKPEPSPAKPAAEVSKPEPQPQPEATAKTEAPAPAAPKTISSIIVMDEVSLGALAAKHGTTTEQLNALNNWTYKGDLVLARGSEVYVPGR